MICGGASRSGKEPCACAGWIVYRGQNFFCFSLRNVYPARNRMPAMTFYPRCRIPFPHDKDAEECRAGHPVPASRYFLHREDCGHRVRRKNMPICHISLLCNFFGIFVPRKTHENSGRSSVNAVDSLSLLRFASQSLFTVKAQTRGRTLRLRHGVLRSSVSYAWR